MDPERIALPDVEAAAARIRGAVRETPLVPLPVAAGLHLKLESFQATGSFKIRGATNAVEALSVEATKAGVSTVSAGNHGLALAVAAGRRGVAARVFVPETAVLRKVDAMRRAGADVRPAPVERLGEILERGGPGDGTRFVPPFGDALVAAGNGTVGLEIARALPEVRTVLVPVGGGGLALGTSTALRALVPAASLYGVTAEGSPAVRLAWEEGRFERVRPTSVADGLGAPVADPRVVRGLKARLDGLLVVDDSAIRAAMRLLALEARLVAEPAGAAAAAAALARPDLPRPVVAVVSGGNVDPALLREVLA